MSFINIPDIGLKRIVIIGGGFAGIELAKKLKNKGIMATIGKNKAVVDLPWIHSGGMIAWFLWMFVHLMALIGFRNRLVAFIDWFWNYLTYDRALRLIIRPYLRH